MDPERDAADAADAILDELLTRGRTAWPALALSAGLARAHLAAKASLAGVDAPSLCAEDLYLAAACLDGDRAALAAFETQYLDAVPRYLGRMRLDAATLDEVRQQLAVRLLVAASAEAVPRLAEYGGRGRLEAWVRVAATRLAIDLQRARGLVLDPAARQEERDGEALLGRLVVEDAELELLRRRHAAALQQALVEAFAGLSPEQRNLLRLSYRDGRSIDEIGALFGVHRATVARRIAQAREQILGASRDLLQERLALSSGELDSLIGALGGHVHLSVSRLLAG